MLFICIYKPRYNLAVLSGTTNNRRKRNAHGNSVYLKRINYRFALHGESVARVAFFATCYARCATILQSVVFFSFLFSFSFFGQSGQKCCRTEYFRVERSLRPRDKALILCATYARRYEQMCVM